MEPGRNEDSFRVSKVYSRSKKFSEDMTEEVQDSEKPKILEVPSYNSIVLSMQQEDSYVSLMAKKKQERILIETNED